MTRIVIVGGPRRGKSTLANQLGVMPIRCGDPKSKVKEPLEHVTYLPEGLKFAGDGGAADWVARKWFTLEGPWTCEGHVMARALRRWLQTKEGMPCDKIVVLDRPAFSENLLPGQRAMHSGVMRVWREIAAKLESITEVIR
jgi:hypothetical protein